MTFQQWFDKHYPQNFQNREGVEKMLRESWIASAQECVQACTSVGDTYRQSSMKVGLTADSCARACRVIGMLR